MQDRPIPENIKELAKALHESIERDLTPEQRLEIQLAMDDINEVVAAYGDAGKVALALCAADFSAE